MNHHIPRTFAATLLALAALAFSSSCARDLSLGHVNQSGRDILAGEYEAAIAEGTKAIEVAPDYHLAYMNRGAAYTYARHYDLAQNSSSNTSPGCTFFNLAIWTLNT